MEYIILGLALFGVYLIGRDIFKLIQISLQRVKVSNAEKKVAEALAVKMENDRNRLEAERKYRENKTKFYKRSNRNKPK